jgi:mycothiol synthase
MPEEVATLTPLVEAAAEAGDLAGGSESRVEAFVRYLAWESNPVAVAWEDGQPVGFVSPEFKVLVVAPPNRRQGHGARLVEAGLAIERERQRANLLLGPPPGSEGALAFLRATGFDYHSTVWALALPPDRVVTPPSWPASVVARQFDRTRDIAAWVVLFGQAFAEHPTPMLLDEATVAQSNEDPAVDDADLLLLEDPAEGGAVVGFCSTDPHRENGKAGTTGEIWTIGVRPDRQGHGLGRQLLRWGTHRLRGLGVVDVTLAVNARNEHALRLYEEEGFVRSGARERWARPVAPQVPHPGSAPPARRPARGLVGGTER